MFSLGVANLEKSTGNFGVDVQLIADIIARRNRAYRSLGLDPVDTNGPELYQALMNLVKLHDRFLAKRLGADDLEDVDDILQRIRIASQNVKIPRTVWAVKPSVLRKLLKAANPKATMKALGYRSIDSMFKREPVGKIILAVRLVETALWQAKLLESYKRLTPLDFETRDIEIVYVNHERWRKLSAEYVNRTRQNIVHSKEFGVIGILPLPVTRMRGVAIGVFPRVLHYINELRTYCSFFRLHQVRPDFGKRISETIKIDPHAHISVLGHPLHWRIVHRHYGNKPELMPDLFEPHLTEDDMAWRHAEYTLFTLEPALQFWHELDYVGVMEDGRPVSFSLIDMAANYINNVSYENRIVSHMRQTLWSELYIRYIGQPSLHRVLVAEMQSLRGLIDVVVEPELPLLTEDFSDIDLAMQGFEQPKRRKKQSAKV